MQFKITDLLFLSLAALAAADCDGDSCTTTTTDVNGAVITNVVSNTNIVESTSLVPVLTQDVETNTNVDVNTNRQTISETTDIGTTPTNTVVQVATTTDVNLGEGYAYTTNDAGSTIATYTGEDDNAPRTSALPESTETEDSFAMATAVPYVGAAAFAGLAFLV